MVSSCRLALIGAVLTAWINAPAHAEYGRTAGSFHVSGGVATYSIPIWTPPGPNGMTPSIALAYNSASGNGLGGMGWNITAVTSIERCERTKSQDGGYAPVDLSYNDRFCIGGNRLRLQSGTYGYSNSVYFTEMADYSRITAYGSAGSGPQYFVVEAKSGLKYEYGATTSARVYAGVSPSFASTPHRWMLNKVFDRSGNNYVISYNTLNGFAVPDMISWTPTSFGASTYRYEAKFNYSTKTDVDSFFGKIASYDIANRYRLENIQIKSAGVVRRKFRFNYDTSTVTSRSRLTSAKECADDAETVCLLPITFSYQTGTSGITSGTGAPPLGSSNGIKIGRYDFNGDGKDDILYLSGSVWTAALSTGTGFSGPYSTGLTSTSTAIVDRFLPNGRDAVVTVISGVIWVYRWDNASSSFVAYNTGVSSTYLGSPAYPIIAADYDGDGLADLVYYQSGTAVMYVRRNNSTGGTNPSFESGTLANNGAMWGGLYSYFGNGLQRADVNGDGRQDIYAVTLTPIYGPQGQVLGMQPYTTTLLGSSTGYSFPPEPPTIGGTPQWPSLDFNGDACTDRLINGVVHIAKCQTAAASTVTVPVTPLRLLDWDGDGKTDFLVDNGGNFGVYRSTGNGFSALIPTSLSSSGTYFALDQDGDGLEDLIKINGTSAVSYWTHTNSGSAPAFATNVPDLLSGVSDGFGVSNTVNYVSTAWGNYSTGTATNYPLQESEPMIVVAQTTNSDGIGATYTKTYTYIGARINAERGESAGFQRIDEVDSRNNVVQRTYFEQAFPLAGSVSQVEVMQPGGVTAISRTVNTNGSSVLDATVNNQRYYTYLQGSTTTQFEVGGAWNGSLLRTIVTANVFDNATGTMYDTTKTTTEPASGANGVTAGGVWIERTYSPTLVTDFPNWCIGRPGLTQQINSHNMTYGSAITRTVGITWNTTLCRRTQTQDEPGNATLQVTTGIGYDSFGNVSSTTVTGIGMTPRTTTSVYTDSTYTTGQFPLSVTNALSQVSTTSWNYDLAVPAGATDPNGITTSWQYDGFGRRVREDQPDTTYTTWDYYACGGSCASHQRTFVDKRRKTAANVTFSIEQVLLDQFDRPINEYSLRADGGYNDTRRDYDSLGRISREYFPFLHAAGAGAYATTSYDLIGRPTTTTRPVSDVNPTLIGTTTYYEGLTNRVVDPQGKQTTKIVNALGQLVRSMDHDGYFQSFDYDAFGFEKRVADSVGGTGNPLQTSTYNLRGMLTARTDVDMGSWGFSPNALGEVISQTDAQAQTTSFGFDLLGRLTSRSEAEGSSTWTWGASSVAKNIGRLASVSGPGYSESYLYDSVGRPSSTTISADTTYQIDNSYNSIGTIDTVTYPTSTSSYRLKLQYEYQNGHLFRIKDFNAPTTVFWISNASNARGQITQETLGNGLVTNNGYDLVTGWLGSIQTGSSGGAGVQNLVYEWDLVGNLKKRRDVNQSNLTEEFFYDNLYRLDYSQLNGVTNLDIAYDALGNITSKSDVGSYSYHATRKHQVTSAGTWSFGYDSNGNMTNGRGATITWTSYNYPASVTNGLDTSAFSYTPERQYWRQIANYTNGGSATTIYVGGILEKVTTSAGTDYRHMIHAGGATIIVSRRSSGANDMQYVTREHLSSSSAVTDSSGGILVNSSFDAFGKRRGSNWAGSPSAGEWAAIAATTRRGFTAHTMLDNLGLIHMNGRAYDPAIGRFISADPRITESGNSQNFNRYSYVYNNPLRNVDPDGFDAKATDCRSGGSQCGDAIRQALQSPAFAAARAAGREAVAAWVNDTIANLAARELISIGCGSMGCQRLADHFEAYDRQHGISMFDAFGRGDLAAYTVVRDEGTGVSVVTGKINAITTHYVFGNGILGNLQRHADLGTAHIDFAKNTHVTEFTLVNNPSDGFWRDIVQTAGDKLGFTSESARLTAHLMQGVTAAEGNVEWVVHSQGGAVYAQAMKFAGGNLSGNSVVFEAGANNRWVTNGLANQVGVRVDGYNYSFWDAVPNIVGLNGTPWSMFGSLLAVPLLFTDHSPHTVPTSHWEHREH